ncbi:MAG: nucleoside triphosphate pyrophosphohydrolase [Deltaproteobacteria bacterium]|jgi:MazG family protein|nr:nucleoside triphosphate pyrophosphohydrolase [Deltaproteobacteria bacterium]
MSSPFSDQPPALPPPGPSEDLASAVARLGVLLDGLLHPTKGCPWDLAQTAQTISEDFLEETYELREALLQGDYAAVREEAGDLLFLLAFLGRLARKDGLGFDAAGCVDSAVDKMVYRHPHVFLPGGDANTPEEVLARWHVLKRKAKPPGAGLLDSVPTDLPALSRAHRLGAKAGRAGLDFKDAAAAREKLREEARELDELLSPLEGKPQGALEDIEEEIGDCLSSLASLARHLGLSAEKALQRHNRKFSARVAFIEKELATRSLKMEDASPETLDELWEKSKKA